MDIDQIIGEAEAALCAAANRRDLPTDKGHARRVATDLHSLFDDALLATAGYLHDLGSPERIALGKAINPDVAVIIDTWQRLRRRKSPYNDDEFRKEILPGLRDPRGAALLAIERLDRWDPSREWYNWTIQFRRSPSPCPSLDFVEASTPSGTQDGLERADHSLPTEDLNHLIAVAAPTAAYCGLWDVRNTLENIAFFSLHRHPFLRILTWAKQCHAPSGICASLARAVDLLLPDTPSRDAAHWEWRHIASIIRHTTGDAHSDIGWKHFPWRFGYVSIPCTTEDACYALLGRLHRCPQVTISPSSFRDFIGAPTPAGYRSLHTRISIDTDFGHTDIAVRFIPTSTTEARPWRTSLKRLLLSSRQVRDGIRVYTPHNAFRDLPHGATVLDFAAAVHRDFVARTRHALINDVRYADPLDVITSGDRIELILAHDDNLRLPPFGWQDRVASAGKLASCLRESFYPLVVSRGRSHLRTVLDRPESSISDEVLDILCSLALEDVYTQLSQDTVPRKRRHLTPEWWMMQIGLRHYEFSLNVPSDCLKTLFLDSKTLLTHSVESAFIASLSSWLSRLCFPTDELLIPLELRQRITRIDMCPLCSIASNARTIEAVSNGTTLTLHQSGAPCSSPSATTITRKQRASLQQYFVVATNQQPDVLPCILSCFSRHEVPITSVMATKAASDWGVVRVELDFVTPRQARAVEQELRSVQGVTKVRGINRAPDQLLECHLPPRKFSRGPLRPAPSPYICGDVIPADQYFYNREHELGELEKFFERQAKDPDRGGFILVKGPLKTGKTSLVNKFRRDVGDNVCYPSITISLKAEPRESWIAFEKRIKTALYDASFQSHLHSEAIPSPSQMDTQELNAWFAAYMSSSDRAIIVIILDEIARPWSQEANPEQNISLADNIFRFQLFVEAVAAPRALLVAVGPAAPINHMPPALQEAFRAAHQVILKPFSKESAQELITASRHWQQGIQIKPKLAKEIWESTGGNPFWVSRCSAHMWERAYARSGRPVKYLKEDFEVSRELLLNEDSLFRDQVIPDGRDNDLPCWWFPFLLTLAAPHRLPIPLESIDMEYVLNYLKVHQGLLIDDDAFYRDVDNLVAMGGIELKGSRTSISSPLLANWLQRTRKYHLPIIRNALFAH